VWAFDLKTELTLAQAEWRRVDSRSTMLVRLNEADGPAESPGAAARVAAWGLRMSRRSRQV